jgi:hypothetical protein
MLDIALMIAAYATILMILLGLVWLFNVFGIAAMYGAVGLIILVAMMLERRGYGYLDAGNVFGPGPRSLPRPGKPQLPRPGPPAITSTPRRALPGPKRSR